MKKCPVCGALCEDADVYCAGCGRRFEQAARPEPGPPGGAPAPGAFPPPPAPYGFYYLPPQNNAFAVASLVLGIAGIPLTCIYLVGLIPAVLAIIFGFIAHSQISAAPYAARGTGFAVAGIILGFFTVALAVVLVLFFASLIFLAASGAGAAFSSSQYTPA